MFNSKEYQKNYARTYRKNKATDPDFLRKRREYQKKYAQEVLRKNPEWVAKERERGREYMRKKRKDPEFRKISVKRHMEWAKKNKEHLISYRKKRYKENPILALKAKEYRLNKLYGLTYEDYQKRRIEQNDKCPICESDLGWGAVDHNHITGKVREIICRDCNLWVGFFEKSPHLVEPIVQYLKRHS